MRDFFSAHYIVRSLDVLMRCIIFGAENNVNNNPEN